MGKHGLMIGIVTIIVGILVLVFPDLLRWIVGIGIIIVGVLAISGSRLSY